MPASAAAPDRPVSLRAFLLDPLCHRPARALALSVSVLLASCGGGGGGSSSSSTGGTPPSEQLQGSLVQPPSEADARRFLLQASFGPTDSDVARVRELGFSAWIDEQFNLPVNFNHLASVKALAAARNDGRDPIPEMLTQSWWTHAVTAPNQLRQRVAYALSQIFVVSTVTVDTKMTAAYLDMLTRRADGTYRDLLEGVALSPAMGFYLSHLSNRKEDLGSGRVPDENFAREVMQLFSIGLYQLDDSARPVLVNGSPVETYTSDDIKGLAKVFTGWSWYRSASQQSLPWWYCFFRTLQCQTEDQLSLNMVAYDDQHSVSAKTFLGVTIPAQATSNPALSLRTALDRLATHANTAPFISRQLIQKLVTSNPSDRYVADITQVFRANGGNLKAVIKAILLHEEARTPQNTMADMGNYGKVREPLLRLSHLMRALPHASINYGTSAKLYLAEDTGDTATQIGQTPMRAPSVFNFYRPGYTPPQSAIAAAGMVAPEMQLSNETTVLGWANFVSTILMNGWGYWNAAQQRPDIRFDFSAWEAGASNASALLDAMATRLLGHTLPEAQASIARNALNAMPVNTALERRLRVQAAVLMVAMSPEFIVQQ
ncbi:MAG: DUF1800 domain-containing protein [Aquabacterium sp.]